MSALSAVRRTCRLPPAQLKASARNLASLTPAQHRSECPHLLSQHHILRAKRRLHAEFRGKIAALLRVLTHQLESHEIPSELIVVEWNPPPERPLLADYEWVRWATRTHVSIRFIAVPPRFHEGPQGGEKRGHAYEQRPECRNQAGRGCFITPKSVRSFYSASNLSQRPARLDLMNSTSIDATGTMRDWKTRPGSAYRTADLLKILADNTVHKHDASDAQHRLENPGSSHECVRRLHASCRPHMAKSEASRKIRLFLFRFELDSASMPRRTALRKFIGGRVRLQDRAWEHPLHRTATVWKDWQRRLDEYFITRHRELAMNLRV